MSIRDEYIKGLRDLADWLEANPAAPLGEFDTAYVQHSIDLGIPDRDDARQALDEAAAELGLHAGPLYDDPDGQYGFRRDFGPVRYVAVSIGRDEDEEDAS